MHPPAVDATTETSLLRSPSSRWQRLLLIGGLYIALWNLVYFSAVALDVLNFSLVSLWFPAAGLSFFVLLALGWAGAPLYLASLMVNDGLLWLLDPNRILLPLEWQLARWITPIIAYTVFALPLRGRVTRLRNFACARSSALFCAAALGASALAALGGTLRVVYSGRGSLEQAAVIFRSWLVGDLIGILTITPLLLFLLRPPLHHYLQQGQWSCSLGIRWLGQGRFNRQALIDGLLIVAALLALFAIPWSLGLDRYLPFAALLLLLPLTWITLRNGLRGAVLGAAALDTGLVLLIVVLGLYDDAFQYQLVMIAIACTGLFLGSTVEARNQALAAVQTHAEQLAREVAAKTQDLQAINQDLTQKESYLRALVGNAPVGIGQFDAQGRCCYLNAVGCALTACTADAARGRSFLDFVHPEHRDYVDFMWQIDRGALTPKANVLEFRLDGSDLWVTAYWINVMEQAGPALSGSIVILTDITEQRRKDAQIWVQAHYDALTDLPNRSLFRERFDQSLHRSQRSHRPVALLGIDLDGFKAINDTLGHAGGDELLQQVAARLTGRMRDSDTVARIGGDEFAVILSEVADQHAAVQVAEDIVARLAKPFVLQNGVGCISASVGVVLYPAHAATTETLIQYADQAMYAAKKAGKNQVVVWRPPH